jgi:curli biogenesis system outer membrane secretion channel CsgG
MNVAADLRIVDARTTRVVRTVSVQKQIIGEEVRAGVYRFAGDYLFDVNAGTKDQEPMQMGVRVALEYGVLELLSPLYANRAADCAPQIEYAFRRS